MALLGMNGLAWPGLACFCLVSIAWPGLALLGLGRPGPSWYARIGPGLAFLGMLGLAWFGSNLLEGSHPPDPPNTKTGGYGYLLGALPAKDIHIHRFSCWGVWGGLGGGSPPSVQLRDKVCWHAFTT